MDPLVLAAKNYSPIFIGTYDVGPKVFVGPPTPVTCRFCRRSKPIVTFRKEAHAISQLLGNRQLIVTDECDSCNSLFSRTLEDHLGKFTKPYRVMAGIRGQKGFPTYRTRKKLSRIEFSPATGLQISQYPEDRILKSVDGEKREQITFFIEKHIPAAVYKALVKISLSVMPEQELANFEHARRWILCEDHSRPLMKPLKLLFYFVPGFRPFRKTSIMLLRKNSASTEPRLPYCLLLLTFGNLQYQIMVPSIADNRVDGQNDPEGRRLDYLIPRIPPDFGADWPFGPPEPATVDLSSGVPVESRPFTLSLSYESVGDQSGSAGGQ